MGKFVRKIIFMAHYGWSGLSIANCRYTIILQQVDGVSVFFQDQSWCLRIICYQKKMFKTNIQKLVRLPIPKNKKPP
jgi:hypothetical protein